MKFIIRILLIFSISIATHARSLDGTEGHGGDRIAAEFVIMAKNAVYYLQKKVLSQELQQKVLLIKKGIETTTVNSKETLFLDGKQVDAINYPDQKSIMVARDRWFDRKEQSLAILTYTIILHEYLGIARVDDTKYQYSTALIDLIAGDIYEDSISQKYFEGLLVALRRIVTNGLSIARDMQTSDSKDWKAARCMNAGQFDSTQSLVRLAVFENRHWWGTSAMIADGYSSHFLLLATEFNRNCSEAAYDKKDAEIWESRLIQADFYISALFKLLSSDSQSALLGKK